MRNLFSRRSLLARAGGAAALSTLSAAGRAMESTSADFEIWDVHGHFTGVSGTPEQRVDKILVHADRMGVRRLMLCMGLRFNADPSPEEFRADNDSVLRALAHAPNRLFGFVYLNPKHVHASLEELDRCVADGPMVGIKLWIAMRCDHENVDAIVRRAVRLNVPILQHVYHRTLENREGESYPSDLARLAQRHPDATFIAAHTGNDWEQGIRAIRSAKNVFCEICGSDPTAGMVEMAVRELGAERVLYGSDIVGRSFASQIAKVTGAEISRDAKAMILAGNLQRILDV